MGNKGKHIKFSQMERRSKQVKAAPVVMVEQAKPVPKAKPTPSTGTKLNKIDINKTWQVAIFIVIAGFATFFTGLFGAFQDEDTTQIVKVHSVAHLISYFTGGLGGIDFSPLQTTALSFIYTIFGAHAEVFHLFQLELYIASAFILFLVFKFTFKPVIALVLSLIFLVHPINSQIVYSILSLGDVLMFFFGILSLWILIRFSSKRSLYAVAACFLLSLLSKDTGVLFIIMALLYLFWFNRDRFLRFIYISVLPIALYVALRIHAVGLDSNPKLAPIDKLRFSGRLITLPSVLLLYITKFIFPWKLAQYYYWMNPYFSDRHVLIPLVIDALVIGIFVFAGFLIKKRLSKAQFYTYIFFAIWVVIGLTPYLQIIPVDATASESWFYLSMVGLLGMIGLIFTALPSIHIKHISPRWLLIIPIILIVLLGVRSGFRGKDYENQYTLALASIRVSPDDYNAFNTLAGGLIAAGKYEDALPYAARSIKIYPTYINYNSLGEAYGGAKEYGNAIKAYDYSLKLNPNDDATNDNLAEIIVVYNQKQPTYYLLTAAVDTLEKFPHDSKLWLCVAIMEDQLGNNDRAKLAISKAKLYGSVPSFIYKNIMDDKPYAVSLSNLGTTITINNSSNTN